MRRTVTEMKQRIANCLKVMERELKKKKAASHFRKHYCVFVLLVVNLVIFLLVSFIVALVTFISYFVLSLC